jgi:hypothetical protein
MEKSGSWTLSQIQELCARLRLACHALDIHPDDVRLSDLHPMEADKLRREAQRDVWEILNQ